MKKILHLLCLSSIFALMSAATLNAQTNVRLAIAHKMGDSYLHYNQTVANNLGHFFMFDRVEYYLSGIKIIHDGGQEIALPDKYILVRGNEHLVEDLGSFNVTTVEGIKFCVGVDSPINNADPALQPPASPLYFQSPSMHWGWSSGYRFSAIEGLNGTNNIFQIHSLWNGNYYEQTQILAGVISGDTVTLNLDGDYIEALRDVDLNSAPLDHGLEDTASVVLLNFKNHVFKPGNGVPDVTSIKNTQQDWGVSIYPNPSNGAFTIQLKNSNIRLHSYEVLGLNGSSLSKGTITNNQLHLSTLAAGAYLLVLTDQNNQRYTEKIIIK